MTQKTTKGRKKKRIFDPFKKLTETEQRVFQCDAINRFSLSDKQLGTLVNFERSKVNDIRNSKAYQWAEHNYLLDTIDILQDAEGEAARTLKALLKSDDHGVRLKAAQEILSVTQETRKKKALLKYEKDLIEAQANAQTGVVEHVMTIMAEDTGKKVTTDEAARDLAGWYDKPKDQDAKQ